MTDWDDIRYFLAVARSPTVLGAAERLGVSHSTVLRRIAQLESKLGTHLFEKLPSGYRLTEAGGEVLQVANEMEASSSQFEALIMGRDQTIEGLLRVALPPTLATYLLTPDLARFARLHPEIEIELLASNDLVNLTNREADVAIRVVYDRETLPLNLHGTMGPEVFGGVYISRDLLAACRSGATTSIRWIVKNNYGIPDWAAVTGLPIVGAPYRTGDSDSQIAALREGLGVTTLSCLIGDADPLLTRVPGTQLHQHGCIWVLTQGLTRRTERVRIFVDLIRRSLASHGPLVSGQRPRASN